MGSVRSEKSLRPGVTMNKNKFDSTSSDSDGVMDQITGMKHSSRFIKTQEEKKRHGKIDPFLN